MAAARFELVVDGHDLVFGHVVVDAQLLALRLAQARVQAVGYHLVVAALERQQLARVVVPHAHVVCDLDAAPYGVEQSGEQRRGVQVGRLDEDGSLGVADGGEPGFVLRHVHA